jgi:CoA:oxalate CoA-transferase
MKPLQGIRVLDLTRVLAGPFCTALMADLGAEIIKIEPPQGDDYRHIGPFVDGHSALFTLTNRGKSSVVLDLKVPQAQALARQIAATCDVVVENFRPGVAAKLGLGAEALRAANPALIYCSISGFGQDGPFSDLPAYDIVVQAMSGLMDANGEEGGAPLKVGEALGDLMAGLYAAWGIAAALVGRAQTGQGASLDVAMFDALFSLLPTSHAIHFYGKEPIRRVGNRHPLSTPFGAYATADGHAIIAVLGDRQFAALCAVIGAPAAAQDHRFATDATRTENEPALKAMIEGWSRSRTTAAVVEALRSAHIPTAPILTLAEAAISPHAIHRGLVTDLDHSALGSIPVIGQPIRFNGTKPVASSAATALGAGSRAVMASLGLTETQISGLIAAGILRTE